jgi:heptosyltransferase-2
MRYLIVRLAALGDVVMTSTLLGAIRQRDPDAHITWLCGQRVESLVRLFDDVDDVVVADELALLRGGPRPRMRALAALWRTLARRSFDVTLIGHADARYRLLLLPVRTGRLRSLDHSISANTLPIPGRYYGDENVRLLDDEGSHGPIVGHYDLAEVRAHLAETVEVGTVGVVLAPGGTRNVLRENALRRWPVDRYRALAEQLIAAGHRVTLVGDGADAWVRPHFTGLVVRDEIGAHEIPGTLRVLNAADLVIVHDTGVLHLARLVRAPVIGLFGPTIPQNFLLQGSDAIALWGGAGLACRPCYNGREYAACTNNLCIQEVTVADVMHHVGPLVARRRAHASAAGVIPQFSTTK